jgi:HK97 family phage portal protein
MNPLNWISKKLRLTDGGLAAWFAGSTWTNRPVTPQEALKLSAWYRAVKLYGDVGGALPLKCYERVGDDDRKAAPDHAVGILAQFDPNADQTTQEFWGAQSAALAAYGNTFAEKKFLGDRLVALQPMPIETRVTRENPARELRYQFNDRGQYENLPPEKVLHTRGFHFGGDVGLSPIGYARETLGGALATEEAAARYYSRGLRASGYFTGPIKTPEQAKEFRKNYVTPFEGAQGEGGSLILPPEFDHKPFNITAKDADLIMSRRFNVEDVARFMGTPPILLGHAAEGQTMFGTGVQNIILAWLTLGLDAHLSAIEKSVNKRLFTGADRRRFYVEYDRNALMRADSAARGDFIAKMVGNAQMTPNEGRRKENRMPLPGGDQLFINSTYVPIEMAGQRPARVQPAPGEAIPE